jgi:DNA primase
VAVIPGGLDPADLVAQQGAEALERIVQDAAPLLKFSIDRRLARWDLDRPEQRARALKDAAEVLAPIKESLLADDYASYIADRLFADVTTVKREVLAVRATPTLNVPTTADGADPEQPAPVTQQVRLERELLDLVVRHIQLRPRARLLLAENLLTDPASLAIAQGIATNESLRTNELIGTIEASHPGAAEALSGVTLGEVEDADADAVYRELARRLKEFEQYRSGQRDVG